jgi:Na+-translocating ferredoxin:NAD+ oxidoreductase RnfG subunit
MQRRSLLKTIVFTAVGVCVGGTRVHAKTYLSVEQAQKSLCKGSALRPVQVTLTKEQMKSIQAACKVRVRNSEMKTWKTADGGWFIVDQVIGKHEFIDIAVALSPAGKVKGIEVLEYRESYGHEVAGEKWLSQFIGRGPGKRLEIDKDIRNISGATLSSVHITEGVNRLLETWSQVLRRA